MALSVVDLYKKVLPKTNCKDCGFLTCLAFAGMVVSQKHPLKNCPHIHPDILKPAENELEAQYKAGKWLKKDMAAEALQWARQNAGSIAFKDICPGIGGTLIVHDGIEQIKLFCFNKDILITRDNVRDTAGNELTRNEQTFVYIHLARGGTSLPSGRVKSFKEFPNTVSKVVSMQSQVEIPLEKAFASRLTSLRLACDACGGKDAADLYAACDLAFTFNAFPRVPVTLLFWDKKDEFEADAKLLFDETVLDHLDIEAIMFLSEHLCQMLASHGKSSNYNA